MFFAKLTNLITQSLRKEKLGKIGDFSEFSLKNFDSPQ